MSNWFETKEDGTAKYKLNFEQEHQRRFDYFNTFYGSLVARRVFAEIRTHILEQEVATPESAIAKTALLDLIESIKMSCGVSDQNRIVDAEMLSYNKIESKPPQKEPLI